MVRFFALTAFCAPLALASVLAAAPAPVRAPDVETVYAMHADGIIEVGTDGTVAGIEFVTPLAVELKPALERSLRALRFKPVKVDGQVVRARSGFTVYLAGERADKGMHVNFDGITFGAPKGEKFVRTAEDADAPTSKQMNPPRYPNDLMMARLMADVQLALLLKANGDVEDVRVVRTTLVASRLHGNQARRAMEMFERSAIGAAKHWQANVPANYGARPPERRTAMTSVIYKLPLNGVDFFAPGQWVEVQRSAKRPVDWLPADQKRLAVDMVAAGGGSLSSTSSGLQLVEPLSGRPVM